MIMHIFLESRLEYLFTIIELQKLKKKQSVQSEGTIAVHSYWTKTELNEC